jgi:hypothetical protein
MYWYCVVWVNYLHVIIIHIFWPKSYFYIFVSPLQCTFPCSLSCICRWWYLQGFIVFTSASKVACIIVLILSYMYLYCVVWVIYLHVMSGTRIRCHYSFYYICCFLISLCSVVIELFCKYEWVIINVSIGTEF